MANISFILQGLYEDKSHYKYLTDLLEFEKPSRFIISTAFLRSKGLDLVKELLLQNNDKIDFYVGVRNGVTSAQAINSLVDLGISPILVDTGCTDVIFHPKIYLVESIENKRAKVIVGSANFTPRGLAGNIEGSTIVDLNLDDESDIEFLNEIINSFEELKQRYPKNVICIDSKEIVDELLLERRLFDEDKASPQEKYEDSGIYNDDHTNGTLEYAPNDSATTMVPRMKLKNPKIRKTLDKQEVAKAEGFSESVVAYSVEELNTSNEIGNGMISSTVQTNRSFALKWVSKPLTERDLNIPRGRTTNLTGSMTLSAGNSKLTNFQVYFRYNLFAGLNWSPNPDARYSHLEIAQAPFELWILGSKKGVFNLEMKHDPRTNTASYLQRNAMTHLKWKGVAHYIKNPALLGKILKIYQDTNSASPFFKIEID